MMFQIYTNKDGWKEVRLVPEDLPESQWYKGLLFGPPDLSDLFEDQDMVREVNNRLVDAGLYDYETLQEKRHMIMRILADLGITDEMERKVHRNRIIIKYQQEFISRRG